MLKNNLFEQHIDTIEQLKEYINRDNIPLLEKIIKKHPMKITKYYLSLIDKHNKNDPIAKMVIPSIYENDSQGLYDTSGEEHNTKFLGFQHKYKQTALLLITNRCASYCRYCFRKRMIGIKNKEVLKNVEKAKRYIEKHSEINNILITGGDPLTLSNSIIKDTLNKLFSIKHIDFIRIGTRIPVVLPMRIYEDKQLLKIIKSFTNKNKRLYIVTHFNHPNEITKKSEKAIKSLLDCGVIINNQTVLLREVNDSSEIIALLMKKLTRIGITPYYIFQCRPVKHIKNHFQVPLKKGMKIIDNARKELNGIEKRFKFVMSHKRGKIEILHIKGNKIYLKQLQAKDNKYQNKFYIKTLTKNAAWFDDLI